MTYGIAFLVLLLCFALTEGRLERWWIGPPLVFTVAGWLVAQMGERFLGLDPALIHHLAEATLVVLLFHDASTVRLAELRAEWGLVARLLLVGLPLTIVAGYGLSHLLLTGLGAGLPLLLAAALAPTDAGLGAPTVLNPVVPRRVRSVLNVESGLNDGLATPVVLVAIALAAGLGTAETTVGKVTLEIVAGIAVGVVVGLLGGRLTVEAVRRGWVTRRGGGIAVLTLPFLAYIVAVALDGNGFIAAFVAGIAFGAAARSLADDEAVGATVESVGDVLGNGVWYLFGAVVGPVIAEIPSAAAVGYALLSLTLVRMVPVALALLGSRLRLPTVAFIGWFGPRGLASIIFALLSVEELVGEDGNFVAGHAEVLAVIGLTVVLSIFAHGLSGAPLAERYGGWFARTRPPVEAGAAD